MAQGLSARPSPLLAEDQSLVPAPTHQVVSQPPGTPAPKDSTPFSGRHRYPNSCVYTERYTCMVIVLKSKSLNKLFISLFYFDAKDRV